MEWCLDCHRQPEKYLRPKGEVYSIAWQPPANQLELGRKLAAEYERQDAGHLLHVPPMSQEHDAAPSPSSSRACAAGRAAAARAATGRASTSWPTTPAFLEFLHREFPEQASMFEDPKGRREFLTLMGASLALAGLTACTKQPEEKILPYVRQPEELVPGPAALLRDRRRPRRLRARHPRREPRGPADQDRGQPRPPGEPRRDRRLRPGPRARPLRPRPLARPCSTSARTATWGDFRGGAARGARAAEGAAAARACASSPAASTSPTLAAQMAGVLAALPAGEVGELGAGRPRQHARGRACSPSASRSRRSTASTRPT